MTLQIALIIIGIITIVISCFVVDKSQNNISKAPGFDFLIDNELSDVQKNKIREKIDEMISEASEEVIVRTDDTLSKISNEKIIAVNEFSDQILEKINRNHEEVIFLYNMLNDKEKEIKSTVHEVNTSKKIASETIAKVIIPTENNLSNSQQTVITQADRIDNRSNTIKDIKELYNDTSEQDMEGNNNTRILELYKQGKSIVDISKELDLGQGEVKLVIDLFIANK